MASTGSQRGRGIGAVAQFYLTPNPEKRDFASGGRQRPMDVTEEEIIDVNEFEREGLVREQGEGHREDREKPEPQNTESDMNEYIDPQEEAPSYRAADFIRSRRQEMKFDGVSEPVASLALWAGRVEGYDGRIEHYIRQCAYEEGQIGLLQLDRRQIRLWEWQGSGIADEDGEAAEMGSGGYDLLEALVELGERCGTLGVDLAGLNWDEAEELMRYCGQVVVFCSDAPEEMVSAYKCIKRLWQGEQGAKVSVFVSGVADEQRAVAVFEKLAQTSRDFLGLELQWAGSEQYGGEATGKELGRVDYDKQAMVVVSEYLREQSEKAKWDDFLQEEGAVLLEGMGHGQRVLKREKNEGEISRDVETRGIGEAKTEKEPQVEAPAREEQAAEARMPIMTEIPVPAEASAPVYEEVRPLPQAPLPVARLPKTDLELMESLVLALPGWLTCLPSGMAAPINMPKELGSVRVLIDGNGRLSILGASLTGQSGIWEQGMRARKWLTDNLELMIGHCRQLRIDRSMEVGMVMVVGSGAEGLRQSCGQISDFPCHVLQLHLLQNDGGNWLLVV